MSKVVNVLVDIALVILVAVGAVWFILTFASSY